MFLYPSPSEIRVFLFYQIYNFIHPLSGINIFSQKPHLCKVNKSIFVTQEHAFFIYNIQIFLFENDSMVLHLSSSLHALCYMMKSLQQLSDILMHKKLRYGTVFVQVFLENV